MKYLAHLCRLLVGIVFIISGIVKTIDPIGFSYKLEEYFGPTVFDIPFLYKLALPLSIFFVIFEVLLGVFLLLGVWKKFTVYSLLLLIIIFTFLTFYSAYFNKVTDCGCFGDAIKLSPWQSFGKDLILGLLILILVVGQKYIYPLFIPKVNWILIGISSVICLWIAYEGIARLPLVDFRPYAVGKDLVKGMSDGTPEESIIVYTLKNVKNNQKKKVTAEEYISSGIWEDQLNWEIINTDKHVIKEQVLSSVHDFTMDCGEGDISEEVLKEEKIAVFTIPFAAKLSRIEKAELMKVTSDLKQKKVKFIILTNDAQVLMPLKSCITDQTTLKTINRGNPGVMIVKKGIVSYKYHSNNLPSAKEIERL